VHARSGTCAARSRESGYNLFSLCVQHRPSRSTRVVSHLGRSLAIICRVGGLTRRAAARRRPDRCCARAWRRVGARSVARRQRAHARIQCGRTRAARTASAVCRGLSCALGAGRCRCAALCCWLYISGCCADTLCSQLRTALARALQQHPVRRRIGGSRCGAAAGGGRLRWRVGCACAGQEVGHNVRRFCVCLHTERQHVWGSSGRALYQRRIDIQAPHPLPGLLGQPLQGSARHCLQGRPARCRGQRPQRLHVCGGGVHARWLEPPDQEHPGVCMAFVKRGSASLSARAVVV